jgi:hypothetical protein
LGRLLFGPPFTGASARSFARLPPLTPPLNLPAPGRRQCVYGALCGLARTCVFAKQSLGPILCGLGARPPRGWLHHKASLLPKLRDHYAEFLDHVSLVHLRLLASPTCVGLRYGRPVCSPPSFSCPQTLRTSGRPKASLDITSQLAPTGLYGQSTRPRTLRFGVPGCFNTYRRGRNVNRLSIGYAFGASP